VKLRPPHLMVLAYAEWCINTRRAWPPLAVVARDCTRGIWSITHAFNDLQAWGLLSCRHVGDGSRIVVRLGDGRETRVSLPPISTIVLRNKSPVPVVKSRPNTTRIAA